MKIVLMESLGIPAEELAALKAPLEARGHVFADYARTASTEEMIREARDADAMILANMPMPAEVLEACPSLKFIDIAFTGVDHVALSAVRGRGVTVSNASGYSTEAVAELVLGMAVSLARKIEAVGKRAREQGTKDGLVGFELKGKTVGIIGLGKIGSRSAELFHALGCTILAHSRTVHKDAPEYIRQVALPDLLMTSDLVVLHCPLTESTRGMINAERLSMMKPGALLINVARGPVVVSADLADALRRGVIAGAGIDVFDREPPLPEDEPLLSAPNCLVTPHVAFATRESMSLRARIVFRNLEAWLEGNPENLVP